ncbi:AhpC/TSA family protein [Pedobacter panaciterrae]|jgi:Peroxiredoxin|uniref:TlpA disulfide reductase family protein n=1 Tax=Pedobacter panaciterrae TaxID=363849 RepID=UPI00155DDEB4|nr:TlpA disulfide reductase family protein [Pedobacter panaciterrae]NQX53051.1 AhpC/TSA family protein [Pedobacter panaciterrae]
MKLKFLILAALAPVAVAAQTPNFTITGKIGNLNKPAKIYLDYTSEGNGRTDSVELVDGKFKFSGNIAGIASSRMTLSREGIRDKEIYGTKGLGDVIYVNFGKEDISITSADSLYNAKWTGSKVYDEMKAFDDQVGPTVMTVHHNANVTINRATPEQQQDTMYFKVLDKQVQAFRKSRGEKMLEFAKANPHSYFALQALSELVSGYNLESAIAMPIFNKLGEELRLSYGGQGLYKLLNAHTVTALGAVAPNFTQKDVNGKLVSLSDYKGKLVLVEFWASWCSPCRAESPNLLKQYAAFKGKGFEILGVSVDGDKVKWLDAIKKDGLTWTQVSDLKGWDNDARKVYGISGVPANFLISPEGKIIGSHLVGEALNKKLAELLN